MIKAFNLRGTNGSGKTYVAQALLEESGALAVEMRTKKHPLFYKGSLNKKDFFILGSYENACGGCDTIPSVHIVAKLLDDLMSSAGNGVIFYEGLMISHMIGTVGAIAKKHNERHTMAFLDTPLDTCIERVRQRRLDAGNTKPFDPNRTLIGDYKAVRAAHKNARMQGFQTALVDHTLAVDDVKHLLQRL
jgi:uridine kinase